MAWIKFNSPEIFGSLLQNSKHTPQFIFKHSTRCGTSALALNRLHDAAKKIDIYIIDVINNRDISNAVGQKLDVTHQSPQLLVISGGICQYHVSHMQISSNVIQQFLSANS